MNLRISHFLIYSSVGIIELIYLHGTKRMIYIANRNIGVTGGGDANVTMEILDSLSSSGHDVTAVTMKYTIPDYLSNNFSKIKNFTFPFLPVKENYSKQKLGYLRYFLKKTQAVIYLSLLKRQFRKDPPQLIMVNDLVTGQYILNEYHKQTKTVQVVHALPSFFEDFKGEKLEEFFDTFSKADYIIFVSEDCRKQWLSYGRLDKNKTYCFYNCANEKFGKKILSVPKSTIRKKLNMRSDTFYLVTVASFNYEKGLDILIDSASELKRIAPNLEVLVIGAEKAKYAEYLIKKSNDGSLDFLNILGFKSNAMEYIYAADAFILPSRVEAFPLVILESMLLKTPVLASRVGGIPEMIEHDKTGLLFERENVEELIERFKAMYLNKDDRNQFAEKASKKYWDTFSKEKFTERYVKLANRIMD
jgi:glycosyltransferase involved in cell wall biosynthesis